MNNINIKKYLKSIPLLFLVAVTLWLRLANLGYSDFQGDEIKALYRPTSDQTFSDFLFAQRKGPGQFIVTYLTKFLEPAYFNQFLHRLPFAIAGILAIWAFYKMLRLHFGKKVSLYASLLLSINGLLVAFSRIAQYQSFSILFSILALYTFSLSLFEEKWKIRGWYLGMISWGLSMLFHYDGLFIAPFVLYIFVLWYKKTPDITIKSKWKNIITASILGAVTVALFYVPFFLSVDDATKAYWLNRLSGGTDKLSSSAITFKLYNPKYILYIYGALATLSLAKIKKNWMVLLWALVPFSFMEFLTNVPGTHIYTYVIPGTVLAAFGIRSVENIFQNITKGKAAVFNGMGIIVFFLFAFLLSNAVFVENKTEYPWEQEKFLLWDLHKPNGVYHLSLFGFPYFRHWEEAAEYIFVNDPGDHYSTNERKSIPRFYVPLAKDTDNAGFYVYIVNPQSYASDPYQEKARYWIDRNNPVVMFENNGRVVTKIYKMTPGTLDSIMEQ